MFNALVNIEHRINKKADPGAGAGRAIINENMPSSWVRHRAFRIALSR
jgi:hypothetical protein